MSYASNLIAHFAASKLRVYVVVTLLGLGLRLAWVLAVDRDSFAFNDTLHYHVTASSIVEGLGFEPLGGGPTARWPPGYPVLLAGAYFVFGSDPLVGEIMNACIGAATIALVMMLADRTVGWTAAVVAGLTFAVLPGPILWTDVLLSETLYTALFVAFFLLVTTARPTLRWMAVLGLAIGVGALVRGEALTWGLLVVVAFWSEMPRVELAKKVGVAAVTAILVLVPWTVRNAVVMDAFVPIATNASETLWAGHNPDATGGQVYKPIRGVDESSPGPARRELDASAAMRREAIEFMLANPVRELELIPLKLIHLNRGDSYAMDWVNAVQTGQEPPLSPINSERIGVLADFGYYSLLALTLLAVPMLGRPFWRTRFGRCAAVSFATALVLYGFVYYGNYRYRLPYEPLMIILSATLVTRMWQSRTTLRVVPAPLSDATGS